MSTGDGAEWSDLRRGRARSEGGRPAAPGRDCAGYRPCRQEHSALDRGLITETEWQVTTGPVVWKAPAVCLSVGVVAGITTEGVWTQQRRKRLSWCDRYSAGPGHMSAPWGAGAGDLAVCGFPRSVAPGQWYGTSMATGTLPGSRTPALSPRAPSLHASALAVSSCVLRSQPSPGGPSCAPRRRHVRWAVFSMSCVALAVSSVLLSQR